jgi:polar amino acid transport system substrate-binding protein
MNKKFVIFALIAIVAIGTVFAGGSNESGGLTKKAGVLLVGMEIGYPPMEYFDENQKPTGFDVEMMKAVAEKMGLTVEFVDTAWDGIFAGVDKGDYDCIASAVTMSEARLQAHNFSKPYIANSLSVCMPAGSAKISSLSDLAGMRIAYQAETTSDYYLADYMTKNNVKFDVYEYDKVISCFDELNLKRVDAIITDTLVAVDYVGKGFDIVWEGSDLGEFFGICMKKGNDNLKAAIDKALTDLFNDGTMVAISKKVFAGVDMVSAAKAEW